jgi:hypothetical protein
VRVRKRLKGEVKGESSVGLTIDAKMEMGGTGERGA